MLLTLVCLDLIRTQEERQVRGKPSTPGASTEAPKGAAQVDLLTVPNITGALSRTPPAVTAFIVDAAAEAKIALVRIGCAVSAGDEKVHVDAGLGYTDREIADRRGSTPGAIRVRLFRLCLKLAA